MKHTFLLILLIVNTVGQAQSNNALDFAKATNDHVLLPTNFASTHFSSGTMTFEAWIKPQGIAKDSSSYLVSNLSDNGDTGFSLELINLAITPYIWIHFTSDFSNSSSFLVYSQAHGHTSRL